MKRVSVVRVGLLVGVLGFAVWSLAGAQNLEVPAGFDISVFAEGLGGVRTLEVGPDGLLYAVRSRDGTIHRLDPAGNGGSEEIVDGLNRPYGLAFSDGWMYVGERHRIVRFRAPAYSTPEVVVPDLPTGGSHWTREIEFGSDGMLYVSVGSSCNICEERDPRRAAVTRYRPDGSDETIVAEGLRNSAGLAVHPATGTLWVSQNERDMLGDDLPVEEINILSDGTHFGWPYCHGQGETNPEYRDRAAYCRDTTPPALSIQAHSAPLGMAFYTGEQFPAEYRGDLFVALHGSWNRSERTGYKLIRVRVENDRPVSYEDFATGWLSGRRVTGRPVYPVVGPDGSLFLSDDEGGRIYRIRWTGPGE
ncbi:MAG: PQQ-dependent sugar dehydrogenase [Gemmatimonadetes bacterium]|nr:PQQ-dependent sugar dehydrogenase [Gemmatimonadota bacterium]